MDRVDLHSLRIQCSLTSYTGVEGVCQWCDKVLPSGKKRTVYCSDSCSRAWERNHVWRKARTAARRRDKYSCTVCKIHKTVTPIEVNHIVPINGKNYNIPSCIHHQNNLETLCVTHHKEISKEQAGLRAKKRKNPDD